MLEVTAVDRRVQPPIAIESTGEVLGNAPSRPNSPLVLLPSHDKYTFAWERDKVAAIYLFVDAPVPYRGRRYDAERREQPRVREGPSPDVVRICPVVEEPDVRVHR